MTILQKLSDRDNFIYEAIKLILVNMGPMAMAKLQWELFNRGIYVKQPLLVEALKYMKENKMISKPDQKPVIQTPKIIVP